MVDASGGNPATARRRSRWRRVASVTVTLGVLAGCGAGQSGRDQVAAVAQAYNRAFVAADGRTICALMTSSLRHEFDRSGGPGKPTSCAEFISLAAASRQHDYAAHLIITRPLPADLQLIRATTVSRRATPGSDLPAAGP